MTAIAYACTSFGSTLMNSVFMFYYVHVYLSHFNVSEGWFQCSQVVYLIWNALNDPLFGYIQDHYKGKYMRSRRHVILFGAPLFVISFLIPWYPWADYHNPANIWLSGVQLTVSLCFYDALSTFVLLAQNALLTELSSRQSERIRLVQYGQVASLLGSSSVFFTSLLSQNLKDYNMFLHSCVVIAFLALVCMIYTGRNAYTQYDKLEISVEVPNETSQCHDGNTDSLKNESHYTKRSVSINSDGEYRLLSSSEEPPKSFLQHITSKICEIFSQQSFISFVLMNFCHTYHMIFLSNFANIICDTLISKDDLPPVARSIFYGALFVLPQVLLILGTSYVHTIGYYNIIKISFILNITSGTALYAIGPQWWTVMLFYLVECISCNSTYSLFGLCLSDIVDVDQKKYSRGHPQSSMVFGTNALVTKPAISFAPMITVAILNHYGYQGMKKSIEDMTLGSLPPGPLLHLKDAMFTVACFTPIIIGFVQTFIWSFYTIRPTNGVVPKQEL